MANWYYDYLRVGDINNNGKMELYGENDVGPVQIYEINESKEFEFVYEYPVGNMRTISDVDNNGKPEVHMTDQEPYLERYYSSPSDTSLATFLSFIFYFRDQLNYQTLGYLDNDHFTDLIFVELSTAAVK